MEVFSSQFCSLIGTFGVCFKKSIEKEEYSDANIFSCWNDESSETKKIIKTEHTIF